jgi:hypothetical protein
MIQMDLFGKSWVPPPKALVGLKNVSYLKPRSEFRKLVKIKEKL